MVSEMTGGRDNFELRHLVIAILDSPEFAEVCAEQPVPLAWDRMKATHLAEWLVERIMQSPISGETSEGWREALKLLGLSTPGFAFPSAEELVRQGVGSASLVPFTPDTLGTAQDLLQTGRDARAFARLISLKGVAPLALAVFGGWGAGKSTFMQRLETEIDNTIGQDPAFVRNVVHVRFNAWQFADTNIWAALTAEFFDQLRAGGYSKTGAHRLARLVEQVNARVHTLSSSVDSAELALEQSREAVRLADENRQDAAEKADSAVLRAVVGSVLHETQVLLDTHKGQLDRLKLGPSAGVPVEELLRTLHAVASDSRKVLGPVRSVFQLLFRNRWWGGLLVLVLASVAGWLGWQLITGLLARTEAVTAMFVQAGVLVALVAGTWRQVKPALDVAGAVAKSAKAILTAGSEANRETTASLIEAEHKLASAVQTVRQRERECGQVRLQLSRYYDPDGRERGERPRLLHYVMEDDPDGRTLEAGIGLIGRAKRLFNAVHLILSDNAKKPEAERDKSLPDRIIIYIDDLDRCSFDQVYAALQAVHLLLAFDSFVVVVGVDPAWVQGTLTHAITKASGGEIGEKEVSGRRVALAERYLEKIFQLAIWLKPLESEGQDGGTYGAFIRALCASDKPRESPSAEPPPMPGREDESDAGSGGQSPMAAATANPQNETAPPDSPQNLPSGGDPPEEADPKPPHAQTASEFATLDPVEVEFLAGSYIAGICQQTPRTVKKMLNIYRLVRAGLAEDGQDLVQGKLYGAVALAVAAGVCSEPGYYEVLERVLSLAAKDEHGYPDLNRKLGAVLQYVQDPAEWVGEPTDKPKYSESDYLKIYKAVGPENIVRESLYAVTLSEFFVYVSYAHRYAVKLDGENMVFSR